MLPFRVEAADGPDAETAALESRVHTLLETSAAAAAKGDSMLALERAKEAGRRERALVKFKTACVLLTCAARLLHVWGS